MASQQQNRSLILGLMSGTSLDGLDMALCSFITENDRTTYNILEAETLSYDAEWKQTLSQAKDLDAERYFGLHARYGRLVGEAVNSFLRRGKTMPEAIASHGHTVFHQPALGFSTQLGCGATIAGVTGIDTICDFRSVDVALGGQGAPLVPIGDALLFPGYEACLNLGGIANVSYDENGKRKAFDICAVNMILNELAGRVGKAYDADGIMASQGNIKVDLLKELNSPVFFEQSGAKSLGREWFEKEMLPKLDKTYKTEDLLATAVEHMAMIIAASLNKLKAKKILVTGGGALNKFLIKKMQEKCSATLIIPDDMTIHFKEALIFAFLGYRRLNKKINSLSTVTGAGRDSIGGAIYLGKH